MASILDHFDALTDRGLKVIPLWENSKAPMCKGWTEDWDRTRTREKLRQFPDANLGLILGDIVDVEGDSEDANRVIADLIGDYPHPSYISTKSIHHLFLTPDKKLRHFRHGQIEFRGFGHQSVIPPSQHQGIVYRWMRTFQFPVPVMPERLHSFYLAKLRKYKVVLKPGHIRVWCGDCGKECMLHEKRFRLELEVFRLLGSKWHCQKCRALDLRPACRLIRCGLGDEALKQIERAGTPHANPLPMELPAGSVSLS
jgi:hypothetical protein